MRSHSRTARPLSGHLWSGALLLSAAAIALAAERLAAAAPGLNAPVAGAEAFGDVGEFLSPVGGSAGSRRPDVRVMRDPFEAPSVEDIVASGAPIPTVNPSRRPARQLTAILIADDRPVAVIDGEVVNVGDVLPDGARVASIRADRVSLLEKSGRWQVLTVTPGRQ